jgi:hypothetical protein
MRRWAAQGSLLLALVFVGCGGGAPAGFHEASQAEREQRLREEACTDTLARHNQPSAAECRSIKSK